MAVLPSVYPAHSPERDNWILERRPGRAILDPLLPYAFTIEEERSSSGEVVPIATIFLTNRECPWRCLMCDLWKNTVTQRVPPGAIPAQIDHALARLPAARHVKLYNSGSFFDPQAIPIQDYPAIASRLNAFETIIVESHPALLGDNTLRLRDLLKGRLEVAMGLETVHPDILSRLNKRMTLDQFADAAAWLKGNEIDLRSFVLVKPPFMQEPEALGWAQRSVEFAFDCPSTVVSLIPTRAGNGAMDELAARGEFSAPCLKTLEAAAEYGVGLQRGRVFADLWDLQKVASCTVCFSRRKSRLNEMNLCQFVTPSIFCAACGGE